MVASVLVCFSMKLILIWTFTIFRFLIKILFFKKKPKDSKKVETVAAFIFLCSKITVDGDCSHEITRRLLLGRKLWQTCIGYYKAETSLCWQSLYSQSYGFFSSHVWMWELDHKEGRAPKNWWFQILVLEKT